MADNDFFRLSYSKIACYQQCRKQYWFKYVSGEIWPAQVDSPASLIGTGVHRAMRVLSESNEVDAARQARGPVSLLPTAITQSLIGRPLTVRVDASRPPGAHARRQVILELTGSDIRPYVIRARE